ncbi:MAG: o-succinylbenzoate--CoA ligase [Chlamydiia bacterium]
MFESLCLVDIMRREIPDAPAVITEKTMYTYQQLHEQINKTSRWLQKKGVKAKQRIAFVAKNKPETLLLFFALARLAVTSCPISTRMPMEQLPDYLKRIEASFYVDIDTFSSQPTVQSLGNFSVETTPLFSLISSSGSTSAPKLIAHTLDNFYYSALGSNLTLTLSSGDQWLMSLPLYHVGGIAVAFRCFLAGAAIVFSEGPLSESLKRHRISHVSLVPTQLYRLLHKVPSLSIPSLKASLIGGAPLSNSLFQEAIQKGLPIFPTYGMTEMSSQITMDSNSPIPNKLTAGLLLPYRELKISDEAEIFVKGPTLFQGYWTDHHRIECPTREGWFSTQDLGSLDPDGNLSIHGRKDQMFISGGENIHPEMIERHLSELPGVIQSFIIPIADVEFGQRPVAFIHMDGTLYSVEEIKERLKGQIPSFCMPVKVFPLPAVHAMQNKVSRKELRDHLATL